MCCHVGKDSSEWIGGNVLESEHALGTLYSERARLSIAVEDVQLDRRSLTDQQDSSVPPAEAAEGDSPDIIAYESAPVHGELGSPTVSSVVWLSLPAILEQLIQAAVGITDTFIAGHIPGDGKTVAAASAAVGTMSYLQWLAGLLNSAFAVGAVAIVARALGARRPRVANRVAGTAVSGAFVLGLAVAIGLFCFARQISALIGLEGLALEYGSAYLQIMTITIALQGAAMVGLMCLRGAGDTVRPMAITGTIALLNILTSSTFTFGWFGLPAWGIRGNAFGTMLAYLMGGVATMVLLLGGWSRIRLSLGHLRIVPHILGRVLRIGMPAWAEGMLLWMGQILIVRFVINRNDMAVGVTGATMAAHTAVLRIESLAFLPGFGFGIACSSLVGRYLGALRPADARRSADISNRLAVAVMTAMAIPMVLFPKLLLGVMVDSAPVVALGVWPMVLAGLAQPGFAVSITKGAALKGAGDTVMPMISTMLGMIAVRVPALIITLWWFQRMGWTGMGLLAAWVGIFADLNFRGVFNWAVFRRGRWLEKRV